MKKILRILLLVTIVILLEKKASGQQNQHEFKPNQYRLLHWTLADGLGVDGMNTMIRDSKRFLWIGSNYGAFCRFDGATFKNFLPDQNNQKTISSNKITLFMEDSLNNIWIGTDKGLSRYDIKADTFTNFLPFIDSVFESKLIAPLCATKNEIFCIEPGAIITAFNIITLQRRSILRIAEVDDPGIRYNANHSFFDGQSKSIWMLSSKEDALQQIFLDGKVQYYSWPCFRKNMNHRHSAEDMRYDNSRHSIWINSGDGLLEFSLARKDFRQPRALHQLTSKTGYDRGVGIDLDKTGRVWFSTFNSGIFFYDPEREFLSPALSNAAMQSKAGEANLHVYCDPEGIVWASNWLNNGLYQLLPYYPSVSKFTANVKEPDSLSNHEIHSIVTASNNEVWLGTKDGLNILDTRAGKFRVLRQADLPGLQGKFISPAYIDTVKQTAWISSSTADNTTRIQLYKMDLKTRQCRPVGFKDGPKLINDLSVEAYSLLPYKKGLLIGDNNHGIFYVAENNMQADLVIPFQKPYGIGRMQLVEDRYIFLRSPPVMPNITFEFRNDRWIKTTHPMDTLEWQAMFYNKKDQSFWVAFRFELVHYDRDFKRLKTYGEEDGYAGMAFNMITDNTGNLWLVNNLHQINRLDTALGVITNLSENEGYEKQFRIWQAPSFMDNNGHIYFGGITYGSTVTNGGLDIIYPERYTSSVTSSVYLRSLTVNHKPYEILKSLNNIDELSFNYDQNNIGIETGVVDYYARGSGRLRYKLIRNNDDEGWQYGPAYYTLRFEGLRPGSYRLLIQASNQANQFNSPMKVIHIIINPPFWGTWWFRTLAVISILLIFYGVYRLRTATLRKQKRILEQTVKERTAEVVEEKAVIERQKDVIQSEKEKSDELLLNILPSEVAQELKEKGYTTAKSFDEVTVLFSDIKGFTNVAEKLTAQELVKEIDTYFSAFDNIILKYGLEKIKTIGDAYIAAGGLPEENSATAQNVIEAGIAMQQVVENLKRERELSNKPYFELRIGIHTGPVVAGVVGIKKFQYDIWGDTVNLAARMEQSGVPGKINISQHTYELVKDQFTFVHRGKIEAKNKGEIEMYFVG